MTAYHPRLEDAIPMAHQSEDAIPMAHQSENAIPMAHHPLSEDAIPKRHSETPFRWRAHQTRFRVIGAQELSKLWAKRVQVGHALLRRWLPGVGILVLALVLAGAATVLAAGGEQTPYRLTMSSPIPTPPPSGGFHYTVRPGDTLYSIARRFGTTAQAIASANGLINPNQIFSGQVLWIPSGGGGGSWPPGSTVYIVQRGDTLYSIARRFGTSYQTLAALNGLHWPYTIYVGQRLTLPGSGTPWTPPPPSQRVHVVQRGETLWSIAMHYGTTPWAIASANGLWNMNCIYVGQRLIIP